MYIPTSHASQRATETSNLNQTILSAPVEDKSGTGSSDTTPTVLTKAGQCNSVLIGAPAQGSNATDRESLVDICVGNGELIIVTGLQQG